MMSMIKLIKWSALNIALIVDQALNIVIHRTNQSETKNPHAKFSHSPAVGQGNPSFISSIP